jgi:hypothetical protein
LGFCASLDFSGDQRRLTGLLLAQTLFKELSFFPGNVALFNDGRYARETKLMVNIVLVNAPLLVDS